MSTHMRRITACRLQHDIEGEAYTLEEIMQHVEMRKLDISRSTVWQRLKCGDHTWDRLLRPVSPKHSSATKRVQKAKHEEMAAVLERLGPPRRY